MLLVQVVRAGCDRLVLAASLLLTGRAGVDDARVQAWLARTGVGRRPGDALWIAERDGAPLASALLESAPGHIVLAHVSPVEDPAMVAPAAAALRAAVAEVALPDGGIVQACTDAASGPEPDALLAAGFSPLAELIRHEAIVSGVARADLDRGLSALTWSEARRDHFQRAVLASDEASLDCMALRGVRSARDRLASHMSAGVFDPGAWLALYDGDAPAGVVLTSLHPDEERAAVGYLGVSPAFRRRGLGRTLLRFCLSRARDRGFRRLTMTIDAANLPALRLTASEGLRQTGRQWLWFLRPAPHSRSLSDPARSRA